MLWKNEMLLIVKLMHWQQLYGLMLMSLDWVFAADAENKEEWSDSQWTASVRLISSYA